MSNSRTVKLIKHYFKLTCYQYDVHTNGAMKCNIALLEALCITASRISYILIFVKKQYVNTSPKPKKSTFALHYNKIVKKYNPIKLITFPVV